MRESEGADPVAVAAWVDPRPEGAELSEYDAEYLVARGVSPELAREMFWTARKPSEVPKEFSDRQRRSGDTLVAAFPSPDGKTVAYQKRDHRPKKKRNGKLLKWVSPPADRARMVLGVVPSMLNEVREGTGPLWMVEGWTRAIALWPFGIPGVSYAGCWNWQKDGEPLPCFDHINLEGRPVFDVPDGDARINAQVQDAQEKRIACLESRGARVLAIRVPPVNGDEKAGLDDYIAAGGDPRTLMQQARPFKRVDIPKVRLMRDDDLRRFVEEKHRAVEALPARTQRECNARKVARYMVECVPLHGKPDKDGSSWVVRPSIPQIAEETRLGSYKTVSACLDLLEDLDFLKPRKRPRNPVEARSYTLSNPCAVGVNMRTSGREGKESQEREEKESKFRETGDSSLYQRDSYTRLHPMHIRETLNLLPAMRNSKCVHTRVPKKGKPRGEVVHTDYFWRYGSKREEIIRFVLWRSLAGVPAALDEVHGKFGCSSSRIGRFLDTWIQPMLNDGVLYLIEDETLVPSPDWREALSRVRERTDEDTDNHLQSQNYARRRKEYREYLEKKKRGEVPKTDCTPELRGKENTRATIECHRPRWERERIEDERRLAGVTASTFLAEELEGDVGLRWAELRQRWMSRGGKSEDLRLAVSSGPFRFGREDVDGDNLYVYPDSATESQSKTLDSPEPQEPASVVPLNRGPRKVDGVYVHGPECLCNWCDDSEATPMPKYVKFVEHHDSSQSERREKHVRGSAAFI